MILYNINNTNLNTLAKHIDDDVLPCDVKAIHVITAKYITVQHQESSQLHLDHMYRYFSLTPCLL